MKKYLFCYDDDNHYKQFWFNKEYIGSTEDIMDLLITIYNYGLDDDELCPYEIIPIECNRIDLDLEEKSLDILHDYLCEPKEIKKEVWEKLIKEDYVNAVYMIRELT